MLLPLGIVLVNIHCAVADRTAVGLQQAQQQIHQGGLSRARHADDTHRLTVPDGQVHIFQHRLLFIGISIGQIPGENMALIARLHCLMALFFLLDHLLPFFLFPIRFGQIVVEGFHRGHTVCNGVDTAIDAVDPGQQTDGGNGKGRQAGYHGGQVLAAGNLYGNNT